MKKYLLLTCVALSGCASIIDGKTQEVAVSTNPPGASCQLVRNGTGIGTIAPTPGALTVEKSKYDLNVVCNKDGYQQSTYLDHSGIAPWTFGNILFGGLIGWGIDSANGADNQYDSPVNMTLTPEKTDNVYSTSKRHHRADS